MGRGGVPVLVTEAGLFDSTSRLLEFDPKVPLQAVADLDGDGLNEVVHLRGILNADGSQRCAWNGLDVIPQPLAVIDVDGDGLPEIMGLRVVWAGEEYEYNIVALDGRCHTKLDLSFPASGIAVGLQQSAADFDGDGESEVALGVTKVRSDSSTRNEFGVAVMELDGTIRWVQYGVDQLFTAADLDGDGDVELIGPDVLDGRTGEILFSLPDAYGYVLPVDVDLDGELELVAQESVAGVNYVVVYEGDPGWAPGPTIWNQEAYNGFNILPDGTLPDPPVPHWKTANTWRAATGQQQLRGIGSDLTVRLTEDCCDASGLRFGAQVGNIGHQDVMRPVELQVWGLRGEERYLLKTQVLPEVPAGRWMPGIDVRVRREARFDDVEVRVVPQGWRIEECDAANNAVRVGQACDGS
jgi:hypothetical protein